MSNLETNNVLVIHCTGKDHCVTSVLLTYTIQMFISLLLVKNTREAK